MSRYVLTRAARSDAEEIHDFIALDSPGAAAKVRVALEQAIHKLVRHPQMGHLRHDLADEPLRFWPVYSYLIVDRPEVVPLEIVRILHASRDVRGLLEA
jgi:antitoxin ParD1/3/4/toxin ParE1/3/4